MTGHKLDPELLRDRRNPHREDCTGTLCPDCGCCIHCVGTGAGECGCQGCDDEFCVCVRRADRS